MVVSQDSVSQRELRPNSERKRHRLSSSNTKSNDDVQHPPKRQKHRVATTTSSPRFWDNLSKQFLTKNALQELDNRNAREKQPSFPAQHATGTLTPVDRYLLKCTPSRLEDIQRFAEIGDINLEDLRGV
ncbi:unnamed protein product [Fusarium langsethiae]|nr:unnamed protein product [Fusarium langsethiae]